MRGIHRKRFRGRIATIDRPDLELDIELWIEERGVSVACGDKPLGMWPIHVVDIDRVGSARFVITLNGEHCAFIAQDPIAFSYEGLKAIAAARVKNKRSYSSRLKRRKRQIPSLKAILVTRAQAFTQAPHPDPEPVAPPVEASADADLSPPTDRATLLEPDTELARDAEPRDPYETAVPEPAAPAQPEDLAAVAQAARRHPRVLDRVRNARNNTVHEHVYAEQTVSGGLIRRICNECGHVSIDISE